MIRIESVEPLYKKLNDILTSKQYSDKSKEELNIIFCNMCVMDNIDTYELEHFINNIIEGLKNIETIEIDTREQLCKIPEIKKNLRLEVAGFVAFGTQKLVVVKDKIYDIHLAHELVHVTQGIYSYNLPQNYDYHLLIETVTVQ